MHLSVNVYFLHIQDSLHNANKYGKSIKVKQVSKCEPSANSLIFTSKNNKNVHFLYILKHNKNVYKKANNDSLRFTSKRQ